MRRIETYDWWPEVISLKDELSLRELAEKFSVTAGAISAAFRRTGTTRVPAPPGPRALRHRKRPPAAETLPPEPGEADAAAGAPSARPGSKDWLILPHVTLLGQRPDSEVAKLAGVSVRTIAGYRARNSIAGYAGPRRKAVRSGRKSRIDPHAHLLGTVPDRVVADKAGVSLNAVRNYRVKRGIAPAPRQRAKPPTVTAKKSRAAAAAAAKVAPPKPVAPTPVRVRPAAAVSQQAWTVQTGDDVDTMRIVVAADLAEAAATALRATNGAVTGLRLLGEVLS